jgi:hypothetical protein
MMRSKPILLTCLMLATLAAAPASAATKNRCDQRCGGDIPCASACAEEIKQQRQRRTRAVVTHVPDKPAWIKAFEDSTREGGGGTSGGGGGGRGK